MDLLHVLAVVTPTLDGDVLARLALADERFTPGQLHRLMGEASLDGVRRALNRLARQGIVDATPVGHAITYRLNREHVAASPIIELARTWTTALKRIEDELATWKIPAIYAAIFGSWARRNARADSDLDLFVVRSDNADDDVWEEQIARVERLGTRWTGNDTRALVMTRRHVVGNPEDAVLQAIVEEGRTVAGDPEWLRGIVKHGKAQ